ncbi:MAG: hypothetical protein LBI42_00835 [Chitinispirillales bacterium]|jgi:tetratricopeptide (TPR) repeat protein|nr:hypothetical protein [Chitinispirillales bacterium]
MIKKNKILWSAVTALIAVCAWPQNGAASQFWFEEIEYALTARTEFLERIDLTDKEFLAVRSKTVSEKQLFAQNLRQQRGSNNPWYYYLSGTVDEENSGEFYGYAVTAAASDPGTLWLLSLEFIRHNELSRAASCMTALEKTMFNLGGAAAPLLSRQLLLAGRTFEKLSAEQADFCYTWAKRFDPDQYWSAFQKGRHNFPAAILSSVSNIIVEATAVTSESFRTQLAFVYQKYRFLRTTLFTFVCAVFLIFSLKYLSNGVHFLGDIIFGKIAPPKFRTISSIFVISATLVFGVYTTLWVIAFMIWKFLSGAEKKLLTLACVILVLAPVDNWITNLFLNNTRPDSTAVVFERVNNEGFSNSLHQLAKENVQKKPENYLSHLSLAISSIKGGDHREAAGALDNALRLAPQDPTALLCAGNISYLLGNIKLSEKYYNDLIKKEPKKSAALFNLAQIQEGFEAANLIDRAAKLEPSKVNSFIRLNDLYFSGDNPPLRRLMQPHISPAFFWSKLFFADAKNFFLNSKTWGAAFLGFNSAASFAIFISLLIVLLILDKVYWSNGSRVKKYFTCRICGQLICRRCRKGMMCSSCYKEIDNLHNSASAINNLHKKYKDWTQLRTNFFKCAVGCILPGTDKFFDTEPVLKPALLLFLSSVIWGACYWAVTFQSSYPSRTVLNPVYPVSILLIYNVFAIIRNVKSFAEFVGDIIKKK